MRTAIITEIKGLSIQTQQNTFVLFTLFKLTLDECKTLTKISTRKTSHNHSPKPAHTSDDNTNTQNANSRLKRRKSCLQSGRYSTLIGISGGIVMEGTPEGEFRIETTGEEEGEEGLETSYE